MEATKVCPICGKSFTYKKNNRGNRKYCSLSCARHAENYKSYRRSRENYSNYNHKGYLSKNIIYRYGGRCAICGWRATAKMIEVNGRKQYAYGNEIHHIIPVADGGEATEDNLILLCPNHHKQANLGIISVEKLKKYIIPPPTEAERQEMINKSVDRVADAIFNQ